MNSADLGNIITSFTLYKFLDTLTTPFTQTQAYRLGIIDANGNLLKPVDKLNNTEKAAYNEFYRLVYSLKRLLIKVPDPEIRARLTNVSSAIKLIAEQCENIGGDSEEFYERAIRELKACRFLQEEGEMMAGGESPANSVGAGGIYGLKPEETTFLSPEAQKRHTSRNSIFRRKKPNKYYTDRNNSY